MPGWLTEKYSRIIKAPYYLYFKECREIRELVLELRKVYSEIDKLPDKVEREHKIRESIKQQKKVVKAALAGLKAEKKMVINVQIEEDIALGIIEKIEKKWEKIKEAMVKEDKEKHDRIVKTLKEIDDMMDQMIINSMVAAIKRDRVLYGDILNLIKAADKKSKDFMKSVKTYMKKIKVSSLERWAGRFEALGVKKYLNKLRKDQKKLDKEISKLGKDLGVMDEKGKKVNAKKEIKAKKDFEEVIKELKRLIAGMKEDISKLFFNAYQAIRRDFMMVFVLLNNLDELRGYIERWVKLKEEPSYPEEEILKDIEKAEENVVKNSQVIAQGLVIFYHKAKAIKKKAEQ